MKKSTVPRPALARRKTSNKAATPLRRAIGRPKGTASPVGRDMLIQKTCELLAKVPLKEVTRAAVARAAGAHPSLIRYYFRDRSAMLLAAFEHLTTEYLRLNEEELGSHTRSADSRLRSRVTSLCRMQVMFPFFHRLIAEEVSTQRSAASRKALKRVIERGLTSYSEILQQGVEEGLMRTVNPAFLLLAIIAMAHSFVSDSYVLELATGKQHDDEEFGEQY
ncbi:MAG TPA: TetR/AcrR family transcriptional regulator, partial [Dyella sp.]|uniref:TetR/AcrR family transcriptional regulator n=1 Tax=Dyella sp. TaxID=1869338 RepID=UPI002D793871